jgi:hypothetical protein
VALVVLFVTPRADLGVAPRGKLALDLLLYSLPAAAALAVALWPVHRAVPERVSGWIALCGALAAACVAALPAMHHAHPASALAEGDYARAALACFAFGTLAALPTFVAMRMLAREGTHVGAKAIAVAVAAALCGSAALFLHCPITHPGHLWAGHVVVLVPAAIWAVVHAYVARR